MIQYLQAHTPPHIPDILDNKAFDFPQLAPSENLLYCDCDIAYSEVYNEVDEI